MAISNPILGPLAAPTARTTFPFEEIRLIGAASGIGAPDKGCAAGPDVIKRLPIERILAEHGINAGWEAMVRPRKIKHRKLHISVAQTLFIDLAEKVASVVAKSLRFALLGGDHSCAIGTWSGAAAALRAWGPLGLVWIDAHMDSHTPDTSPSGALHGMPLACLMGYGERDLTEIVYPGPKVDPKHLCLVGVRSFEEGEARLLERLGVRVFFMQEVQRIGLEAVMREALAIARRGSAGFGVSIDIDAVDPEQAPGVGTPAAHGIPGDALRHCMRMVAEEPKLVGLEIAEFNPLRDVNKKTVTLICDLLAASFSLAAQRADA